MSSGMDAGAAKYLEDNVGGVLAKALAEMAKVQPKDVPSRVSDAEVLIMVIIVIMVIMVIVIHLQNIFFKMMVLDLLFQHYDYES